MTPSGKMVIPRSVAKRDLLSAACARNDSLLLYIPLQRPWSDLGAVDHAARIRRDALGGARRRRGLVRVGDERRHRSIARAADANAALPARALPRDRARL